MKKYVLWHAQAHSFLLFFLVLSVSMALFYPAGSAWAARDLFFSHLETVVVNLYVEEAAPLRGSIREELESMATRMLRAGLSQKKISVVRFGQEVPGTDPHKMIFVLLQAEITPASKAIPKARGYILSICIRLHRKCPDGDFMNFFPAPAVLVHAERVEDFMSLGSGAAKVLHSRLRSALDRAVLRGFTVPKTGPKGPAL